MPISAFPTDLPFTAEAPSPRPPTPPLDSDSFLRHYFLPNPSLLFALLSALPYPPLYFHHFIGDCYIFHTQRMWTKTPLVSVRYIR